MVCIGSDYAKRRRDGAADLPSFLTSPTRARIQLSPLRERPLARRASLGHRMLFLTCLILCLGVGFEAGQRSAASDVVTLTEITPVYITEAALPSVVIAQSD